MSGLVFLFESFHRADGKGHNLLCYLGGQAVREVTEVLPVRAGLLHLGGKAGAVLFLGQEFVGLQLFQKGHVLLEFATER